MGQTLPQLKTRAELIWCSLNDDERAGVPFGLFPADKMPPLDELSPDDTRDLCVLLMRIANGESL